MSVLKKIYWFQSVYIVADYAMSSKSCGYNRKVFIDCSATQVLEWISTMCLIFLDIAQGAY